MYSFYFLQNILMFSYLNCNQNVNTVRPVLGQKLKTREVGWQTKPFWKLESGLQDMVKLAKIKFWHKTVFLMQWSPSAEQSFLAQTNFSLFIYAEIIDALVFGAT